MKKLISIIITALLILSALLMAVIPAMATEERAAAGSNDAILNGKKVFIAGTSYTYTGSMVERTGNATYTQSGRTGKNVKNETGLFARVAKANGVTDLTVTDWAFISHTLADEFGYCSSCDRNHLDDITDRNYDYVVLQQSVVSGYDAGDYVDLVKLIISTFREGNPNTKFYYVLNNMVYASSNYTNEWKKSIELIAELGVTVVDWGAPIYDLLGGNVALEGSQFTYTEKSFMISKQNNTTNPNLLTGYLATVMTYAAITGETTVGQPYAFLDTCTSKYLNVAKYITEYYTYDNPDTEVDEKQTNMAEIFASATEMEALQELVLKYLGEKKWRSIAEYTIEFKDGDEVISSATYKWGETVAVPTPSDKIVDGTTLPFRGWDKTVTECRGDAVYNALFGDETPEPPVCEAKCDECGKCEDDACVICTEKCECEDEPEPPVCDAKCDKCGKCEDDACVLCEEKCDCDSEIIGPPIPDTPETDRLGVGEGAYKLDGKKILFAGCSYTYYGGLIERTGASVFDQAKRTSGETGLFIRLCKKNGVENVSVTDWTYGGHDLTDIFDGEICGAGDQACIDRSHLDDLTDRNYDIVILQDIITPGYKTAEEYLESVRMSMKVFTDVNPDTKFYLLVHHRYYQQLGSYHPLTDSVELIKNELGVEIIDWGALVYDVTLGNEKIPGSVIDYNYNSFVVSNNSSDGYHQNLLSGYLGAIITYAALTGETTIGQPYEFIYGLSSNWLNIDKYISAHYKYDDPATAFDESTTNMKEIFYSKVDMEGLQALAEKYFERERWLDFAEYDVEFKLGDEVVSKGTYKWGESITVPGLLEKPADERYTYTFVGWDKTVNYTCSGNAVYTAVFEKTPLKYTVSFYDDNGDLLSSDSYEWGERITPPIVPDKEDESHKYVFVSWDKTVSDCDGDASYTAVYEKLGKGVTVIFRNYDMTVISIATYNIGDEIVIPENPTRESDKTYRYTFIGWDKDVSSVCDGSREYVATYSEEYIEYTVKFLDHDGSIISEAVYHWGDTISIPAAPTRESDVRYKYTFRSWGATVTETCEGDATYTADYSESYVIYSVVFLDYEGEVIATRTHRYGDTVNPPLAPVKPADENYTYRFIGWDREVTVCEETTSYTAVYEAVPKAVEDETPPDTNIPEDEPHVCEGVNGWHIFWNAIFNFFRRLFGMAELCPCGKTTL